MSPWIVGGKASWCHLWADSILLRCFPISTRGSLLFVVEHEEYLEAVDLTSYVGTISTWLASDMLSFLLSLLSSR